MFEHMKGGKKRKVVKKTVNVQKIGYGHRGRHHGRHHDRPHHSFWRRPVYFRPPPVITRPVYTVVERPTVEPDDSSSTIRTVMGVGLVASFVALIVMALKR